VTLVIDASVILRSLVGGPDDLRESERAAAFLVRVAEAEFPVLQPAHWLADVAGALVRVTPHTAVRDVAMLAALDWPECREPVALTRACELAARLGRPVRETLYHAVALEADGGVLITADASYRRAARRIARVVSVEEWAARDRSEAGGNRGGGPRSGRLVTG
jgi:predicted nucleic acid-binding protein